MKRLRDYYDAKSGLYGYDVRPIFSKIKAEGVKKLELTAAEYAITVQVFECPHDWDGKIWGIELVVDDTVTLADRVASLERSMAQQTELNARFERKLIK